MTLALSTVRVPVWRVDKRLRQDIGLFVAIGLLVLIWQLAATLMSQGRHVLPAPLPVFRQMWDDRSIYWPNVSTTLSETGLGLMWGVAAALLFAVAFVQVPFLERLLMGAAVATYCVPIVAIAPIVQVMFGGMTTKVVLAALAVLFPMLVATALGLRSADPASLTMVRAFGGGSFTQLWKVRLRAALPSFFAGLRIAAPAAVLGAIIGEYLGGDSGIGIAMISASQTFAIERVWGLAIVASGLALLLYVAVGLLARLFSIQPTTIPVAAVTNRVRPWARNPVYLVIRPIIRFAVAAAALAGLWIALLQVFSLDRFFAKTPSDVFAHLFTDPDAHAQRSVLVSNLMTTLRSAAPGFVIGVVSAVLLAVCLVSWRSLDRAVMPLAIGLQSAPLLAMTPLIVLTLGRDILGLTVIVVIATFFPTLINVMRGLRSAPTEALDMMHACGGTAVHQLLKVKLQCALPSLFASLRIAVPGALFGTMLAEWIATGNGLGHLIIDAGVASEYAQLWSGVALITLTSMALYYATGAIESLVLRHYAPEQFAR